MEISEKNELRFEIDSRPSAVKIFAATVFFLYVAFWTTPISKFFMCLCLCLCVYVYVYVCWFFILFMFYVYSCSFMFYIYYLFMFHVLIFMFVYQMNQILILHPKPNHCNLLKQLLAKLQLLPDVYVCVLVFNSCLFVWFIHVWSIQSCLVNSTFICVCLVQLFI